MVLDKNKKEVLAYKDKIFRQNQMQDSESSKLLTFSTVVVQWSWITLEDCSFWHIWVTSISLRLRKKQQKHSRSSCLPLVICRACCRATIGSLQQLWNITLSQLQDFLCFEMMLLVAISSRAPFVLYSFSFETSCNYVTTMKPTWLKRNNLQTQQAFRGNILSKEKNSSQQRPVCNVQFCSSVGCRDCRRRKDLVEVWRWWVHFSQSLSTVVGYFSLLLYFPKWSTFYFFKHLKTYRKWNMY